MQFIWVGKTRKPAVKDLVDDYLERVKKFTRVEVREVREVGDAGGDWQRCVAREGEEILAKIGGDTVLITLEVGGQGMSSFEFAEFLDRHQNRGSKQLAFVIGGPYGLAEAVSRRADARLSLSRMTLTHELARVFLVEQVYRAFAILHRLPYQK